LIGNYVNPPEHSGKISRSKVETSTGENSSLPYKLLAVVDMKEAKVMSNCMFRGLEV